ncbi:MAG: hypothetical protein ACKOT0_10635 [bacterium]
MRRVRALAIASAAAVAVALPVAPAQALERAPEGPLQGRIVGGEPAALT